MRMSGVPRRSSELSCQPAFPWTRYRLQKGPLMDAEKASRVRARPHSVVASKRLAVTWRVFWIAGFPLPVSTISQWWANRRGKPLSFRRRCETSANDPSRDSTVPSARPEISGGHFVRRAPAITARTLVSSFGRSSATDKNNRQSRGRSGSRCDLLKQPRRAAGALDCGKY